MAHTPGPWIAQKDDRSTNQPYSIYSELFSTKCDGKFVDDPVALYVEPQNKDLIAAAPDLLEAWYETRSNNELESTPGRLQWLEIFIRCIEANLGEVVGPLAGGDMNSLIHGLAELNTLCSQTRAAIAKAKGEQS